MESLRFYIKENKLIFVFYCFCVLLNIFLLTYIIYSFFNDYVYEALVLTIIYLVIFFLVLTKLFDSAKKFIMVCVDYIENEKEIQTVYVKRQGTRFCANKGNGAYKYFFCSESRNGKPIEYWLYRKSLIYDDVCIGKQYKITYYKKSKCLYSIEPTFDDFSILKKTKVNKTVEAQTKKKLTKQKPSRQHIVKKNNIKTNQKVISEKITTLGIPYSSALDDHIITGVPYKIYSASSNNKNLFLKVCNQNGKRKNLVLQSTDILGLEEMNERPGFMGYGNFIGMEYEVEYYKFSHIVKSMKILNQPE